MEYRLKLVDKKLQKVVIWYHVNNHDENLITCFFSPFYMDISDSISNGFLSALAKEFFSRIFNNSIENKEKIISTFNKIINKIFKKIRDYDLSNNHPNTPFTFNGEQLLLIYKQLIK